MFYDDEEKRDYIKDETLNLNVETEVNNDIYDFSTPSEINLETEQKRVLSELRESKEIDNSLKDIVLDPSNDNFTLVIKDNVNYCVNELREINAAMLTITGQKNVKMFFNKSNDIKLIAQYMSRMTEVTQKTIDLLILLLGAGSKVSDDYDMIMSTIDELGELNQGEAEVLNYLLKIKNMVFEIKDNEVKMKDVIETSKKMEEIVSHADEAFKKEIEESEKSRKLIESRCIRLQRRLTQNNIYIGFCLLLIIGLAVFIALKFYVK